MKIHHYVIYALTAILFASCLIDGGSEMEQEKVYGKVDVAVSVALPDPEPVAVGSRAAYTDTEIKNVDVLVFDENAKFLERVGVEESQLQVIGTTVKFTVRLDATSKKRIIHLVANGRTADGLTDRLNFSSLTPGLAEATAIPNLQTAPLTSLTGESVLMDNIMPLLMWGRIDLTGGINIVTTVPDVKLLRAAACIQVKKAAATASNGLSDLTIAGITVSNAYSHGYLAPAAYTADAATPTTPRPVTGAYLDYGKAWANAAEPLLYVYERNCTSTNYMGVILKAAYKGAMGYYKIAMADDNGTLLNVVRNHRYNITVVSVNGPGHVSIATAISAAPSNTLKVDITDADAEFPCITGDGQYYMAASNNAFNLYGKTGSTSSANGVEICTVYSSRNLTPELTLAAGGSTWLTNLTATALGGGKYRITGNFTSSATAVLSTTLTLKCDNLIQPIRIRWSPVISTQKDTNSYALDLIDAGETSWDVWILDSTSASWLFLHPTASTAAGYPGSGMVTELHSKYAPTSHAYLHVAIGTNKQGALRKSSFTTGGEALSTRIVVAQ